MRHFLNKDRFIRVIRFNSDKSSSVVYYKSKRFKPSYIINPNHVFLCNGYRSIVISDNSPETINPLDFKSKYNVSTFKSAINSKIIDDTFSNLKTNKLDLTQVILFLSLLINVVVLYFILKSNGVF